jgi:putative ABC transport system permease protein
MQLWMDLRLALRWFRRAPAATAIAVGSIALSVGALAAVYTAVRAVLIEPLPYSRPDELVQIRSDVSGAHESIGDWVMRVEAERILQHTRTMVSAGIWGNAVFELAGDGSAPPEALYGLRVTASLMRTLGVPPMLGRGIAPEDEAAPEQAMVLSYGLWMRRFHGDSGVIGRTVTVNGHDCRIVGVMGPEFNFPLRREAVHTPYPYVEFWAPLPLEESAPRASRGMVARLKPGVGLAQAEQDLATIGAALAREFPEMERGCALRLGRLLDRSAGKTGEALWLLMGAAAMFLLIGCANVANLLLARGLAREREMAVRAALGAGRWRIARQLLTEASVLAVAGGAAGYALAVAAWRVLPRLSPVAIPRLAAARADWRVLAVSLAVAVGSSLLFGIMPALRAARASGLGTRGAAAGRRDRVRAALIVAEVSIAVALVVTGGRLVGSFVAMLRTDPGFTPDRVLAAVVLPQPARYRGPARAVFYRRFLDAVRAIPGVESAGTVDALPFSGENHGGFVTVNAAEIADPTRQLVAEVDIAGGDYLQAMGARLLDGRWFHDEEGDTAIVNEAAARRLLPGENAIGKRVCVGCRPDQPDNWKRVVGVVTNLRHWSLEGEPEPDVYISRDAMRAAQFLVLRTGRPAAEYQAALRRAVASVDPQQAVLLTADMRTLLEDSLAARRFLMLLLAATGALALAMSAAGIYGVTAFATSRRTQEIGIRMALGATPRSVHTLVFRQGFAAVAAGLGIGLAATAAGERALRGMLPGLESGGPGDVWIAAGVVVTTAAFACWAPARKAMRVEPVEALRVE